MSFWFEPLEETNIRRCISNSSYRRQSLLEGIALADTCKARIDDDEQASGCITCVKNANFDPKTETCYKLPSTIVEEPLAIPFDFRSYASKTLFRSSHIIHCPEGFFIMQKKKKNAFHMSHSIQAFHLPVVN